MIGDRVKVSVWTLDGGWWEMKFISYRLWLVPILRAGCTVRSSYEAWQEVLRCLDASFPKRSKDA